MLYYDSYYILLILIPLLLGVWAQCQVSSVYNKYGREISVSGMTGFQAARRILDQNGLHSVKIERISGNLTDHYDPRSNTVRLSDGVYASNSIAAIGIAAHECGHAVQYATGYFPLKIRSAVVPVTNFGSKLAVPLVLIGLLFSWYPLAWLGLIGYVLIALFQLITLPVEFNASNRAMATLSGMRIPENEQRGVKKVLGAAALTYVAALVSAVTQLLYMMHIVGGRNRHR